MQNPELTAVNWPKAHRIIRALFPPIDLFEDIADPSDWEAILSAETKTNPRMAETIGKLDQVPKERRVSGEGASLAMAPFTHYSTDRPSRFSDGTYGVYYAGDRLEVALFETIHHHQKFMAATGEAAGWTSDFRQLITKVDCDLYDVRDQNRFAPLYEENYSRPQKLGADLRGGDANGVLYQSVRYDEGEAVALFWPDCVGLPVQGDHFSYLWDGEKVSHVRNLTRREVFAVV